MKKLFFGFTALCCMGGMHGCDVKKGEFILFTGPMCAGKSAELIKALNRVRETNSKGVLAFQHAVTASEKGGYLRTRAHDRAADFEAKLVKDEKEIAAAVDAVDSAVAIGLDEAQFFSSPKDLCALLHTLHDRGMSIYIAALDTDFKQEWWPATKAIADLVTSTGGRIEKCRGALCHKCQDVGECTMRYEGGTPVFDGELVKVGDVATSAPTYYKPACLKCYEELRAAAGIH